LPNELYDRGLDRVHLVSGARDFSDMRAKRATKTYMTPEGVVVVDQTFSNLFGDATGVTFRQIPWDDVTGLDFRHSKLTINRVHEQVFGGNVTPAFTNVEPSVDLKLRGEMPNRIAVIKPLKEDGKRKGSSVGGWVFVLIFLAVIVGVPLFNGGGSLGAAVMPGLSDIYPEAVERAIRSNPNWPTSTRLDLVANAAALRLTPSFLLINLLGMQQNDASSLVFIPLWWVEKLASRQWQVQWLADTISSQIDRRLAS
jgi:hypothetical protein